MLEAQHNIPVLGRKRRLQTSLVVFSAGLLLSVLLLKAELPRPLRFVLFLPFFFAAILGFQAMYKTCVVRATLGQRETICGVERVLNPRQLRCHRRQARQIVGLSALLAFLATVCIYAIP